MLPPPPQMCNSYNYKSQIGDLFYNDIHVRTKSKLYDGQIKGYIIRTGNILGHSKDEKRGRKSNSVYQVLIKNQSKSTILIKVCVNKCNLVTKTRNSNSD